MSPTSRRRPTALSWGSNANSLCSYATFLRTARQDFDQAETYYQRAIDADPHHTNYAGLLYALGQAQLAEPLAQQTLDAPLRPETDLVELEVRFYRYANSDDRSDLPRIHELLEDGVRSPGWDLSLNLERAKERGHPEYAFLERLAAVIADEEDISVLEWPRAA